MSSSALRTDDDDKRDEVFYTFQLSVVLTSVTCTAGGHGLADNIF